MEERHSPTPEGCSCGRLTFTPARGPLRVADELARDADVLTLMLAAGAFPKARRIPIAAQSSGR